jgi:hypothetical protein
MVDSFSIKNFRSFSEAEVRGCRLVNIIVGDNGSGKTALLEGLFLTLGVNPEIVTRARTWRGIDNTSLFGTEEDLHSALWTDLFYKFNVKRTAVISLKGKQEHTRSVTVAVNPPGSKEIVPPNRRAPGSRPRVIPNDVPIEFRWEIRGAAPEVARPFFQGGRLIFPQVSGRYVKAAFFASNQTAGSLETVGRFSNLSRTMEERPFVENITRVFPRIKNISVELSAGAPMLFAQVSNLDNKIPLSLASGGANKLSAILLGIAEHPGGVVIIDEIENGLYYKKLRLIWTILLEFAQKFNCQIFASTHSLECLQAAAEIAEHNSDKFCMMRTVASNNGTLVRYFDGNKFSGAVLDDIEVR